VKTRPQICGRRAMRPSQTGVGLVETLIAVAITAVAITALLGALSTGSLAVVRTDERVTAENVARAQMEHTKAQEYVAAPASYATISAPAGYSISADATSVSGRDADIQMITVSVSCWQSAKWDAF